MAWPHCSESGRNRSDATDALPFLGIRFVDHGVSFESAFSEGYALGVRRTGACTPEMSGGRRGRRGAAHVGQGHSSMPLEEIRNMPSARWIVGADGLHSSVRRWARLAPPRPAAQRFGFRIHYRVAPWTDYMELHWGAGCQIYLTPIGPQEVCAALISRDPHLRLEEALSQFPQLAARLRGAPPLTAERGAVTANCTLPRVYRGNVALVGDASGSVDAITGEGLCLAFHPGDRASRSSLASGGLASYQVAHRRLARRPTMMSKLMLGMDRRGWLRKPAFRAMAAEPRIFQTLLSFHLCVPNFS